MRAIAAFLLLLAPAALCCTEQACSNDPWPAGSQGILGDERLCWDAVTDPDGEPITYQVESDSRVDGPCLIVAGDQTCVTVAGTSCLDGTTTAHVRVRACDDRGACGGWSLTVEFLPHACLRGTCEEPCHPGAPRRLPHLPGCPA